MSDDDKVKPYNCELIHIAYRTIEEKRDRWDQVAVWTTEDSWPALLPSWVLEHKKNHGGGGGP